ncbi:molecular chaperone [Erwinia sp. OLTSP20]|uniref:fimbria/pilus periplasmic chaperone n=1 Tax=unclassified Erwinia TaxID=2622719 RepID=UPI000C1A18E7|nr:MULTISPECIES: fimbria/pilus periplasmic chaperone [unclassified Erwinia]PIJ48550.1 molecular chaperone [Erwinia sp. OAMSP11]PIJ68282.1 molecular chaperone [Erwinia sp. OLSSP12]PIJ78804.1 molecular chaperone [Erwinia sp. OLCASP19]PIJ79963.1 molecular chaperone [Erwinia sp. OLMTSP26]PIJ80648.1 molecular chaperone [Erwinia sp. OLMDSP33]
MKYLSSLVFSALMFSGLLSSWQVNAAISLDRTRVIFAGGSHSMSLNITNENRELPYLAQGWIEDQHGKKITSPLLVLPPLQRVEPGARSQIRIQVTPAINQLAKDRETLFYFNLREIPPKSSKPNTLQIALQTRVKLFYRPEPLLVSADGYANPWQKKLTLSRQGDHFQVSNPTPYYVTLAGASATLKSPDVAGFEPLMVAPKSRAVLKGSAAALGNHPVITYINDFGGRPKLVFACNGDQCQVTKHIAG